MARKIELLRAVRIDGEHADAGQVVEVSDELAAELVNMNRARIYDAPAPRPADEAPVAPPNDTPLNKKLRTRGR